MKTIKEYGELSLREIGIMGIVKQMVKEDILELIDELDAGFYSDDFRLLKQKIEGETAQNTNNLVKTNDLQGNSTAQNDIKLARQCMDFKMLRCDNKNCLNEFCPLQKSWNK